MSKISLNIPSKQSWLKIVFTTVLTFFPFVLFYFVFSLFLQWLDFLDEDEWLTLLLFSQGFSSFLFAMHKRKNLFLQLLLYTAFGILGTFSLQALFLLHKTATSHTMRLIFHSLKLSDEFKLKYCELLDSWQLSKQANYLEIMSKGYFAFVQEVFTDAVQFRFPVFLKFDTIMLPMTLFGPAISIVTMYATEWSKTLKPLNRILFLLFEILIVMCVYEALIYVMEAMLK